MHMLRLRLALKNIIEIHTYTLSLSHTHTHNTHTQLTGNAAFYINLKGSQSGNAEKEVIVCVDMWQQLSVAEAHV